MIAASQISSWWNAMNRLFSLFLLSIILLSVNSNAFHVSVPIASIPKEAQTQESQLQEQDVPPLPSGQSSTNYEILTTSGDSVTITQTVLPIKNDGYLSGDTARIFVEIKNNKRIKKDRDLKGLAIRVILDDELGVVPDSARWLKVYSLDDLCKIKTELYTCPLDESPLITDANKCQNNIKQEYELFSYNDTKLNCIEEVKSIVNKISNIYDINWMGTDTPKIYQFNNFFIINNSNNDSYAIFSGQKNDIIRVDFSDGRSYNLSINTKNNTTYINYTNTIIGFRVDELSPKDSIIFYYDVKPKITGIFNVEIIARTYDPELSHLQDHTFFSKIEVKESNPKFEIKSRPSSTEVCTFGAWNPDTQKYPNFIDVYYDITYLGGASEPYCDNISIKFDPPTKERFYINKKRRL